MESFRMRRVVFNKTGQSTIEYAILIAVIVAALIGMQTYIRRSIQYRLKQVEDALNEPLQYE